MGGRGRSSSGTKGVSGNTQTNPMVHSGGGVVRASNSAQKQLSFLEATASRRRRQYENMLNATGIHNASKVKARKNAARAEEEVMSRVRDLNVALEAQAKKGETFQVWGTRFDDDGVTKVFNETRKKRW